MREGDKLCLDVDRTTPNWSEFYSDNTFVEGFFDYDWLNQEANYMPFVRDNENHGIGGLNPGYYTRSENFSFIIRCAAEGEAELNDVITQIPGFSKFQKIIIT